MGRLFFCISFLAAAGALLAAPTRSASPDSAKRAVASDFPGGPYFALACGVSHRNNDDPIVFFEQPGRSHNHTYVGNRSVDATTTPASLLRGRTTCEIDADASTYWFPTLYVGTNPVLPLATIIYYTRRTTARVTPLPAGLKMVAGNADARSRQPKDTVAWNCGGVGGKPRFAAIPACAEHQALQLRIHFPNCWNGTALDSPDHRRHMAYSSRGRCPPTHPVAVPMIGLVLIYPAVPRHAQVASGRFGAHADFMNGWDQDALAILAAGLS